jgi:Tfp pilus assembly protein PilO
MDLHNERTARWILLGLVTVGLFSIYFGTKLLPFTYRARAQEISALETRYADMSLELERARASVARIGALEAELAGLEQRWMRAQRLLPEETQISGLLREITERGQLSGVDFTLFKPMPVVAQEHVTEHPVEVKVEGGYHGIARFLARLASMERIVHVRELDIEQLPPEAETVRGDPARARFVAVSYVLGGTADGTAPAAGAAPADGGPPSQRDHAEAAKAALKERASGVPRVRVSGSQGGSDE